MVPRKHPLCILILMMARSVCKARIPPEQVRLVDMGFGNKGTGQVVASKSSDTRRWTLSAWGCSLSSRKAWKGRIRKFLVGNHRNQCKVLHFPGLSHQGWFHSGFHRLPVGFWNFVPKPGRWRK